MLFILIPIIWLAVLTLFVAVCRVAAEGDAQLVSQAQTPASRIGVKLTLSRTPSPHASRTRRAYGAAALAGPSTSSRLSRATAHAGRQH
jgi:hypothetical protein